MNDVETSFIDVSLHCFSSVKYPNKMLDKLDTGTMLVENQ